jgi:hypothetical protein
MDRILAPQNITFKDVTFSGNNAGADVGVLITEAWQRCAGRQHPVRGLLFLGIQWRGLASWRE